MKMSQARAWITQASLIITGAVIMFFLVAPSLGYPLSFGQSLQLAETVIPVTVGYLGSAVHFLFRARLPGASIGAGHGALFGLLVRGPIILFSLAFIGAATAFGVSNRAGLDDGRGMTPDQLGIALTIALSVLTGSTSILVGYVFSNAAEEHRQNESAH